MESIIKVVKGEPFSLEESTKMTLEQDTYQLQNKTKKEISEYDDLAAPSGHVTLKLKSEMEDNLEVPIKIEKTTFNINEDSDSLEPVESHRATKFTANERELLAEICQKHPVLADMGYSLDTINKKRQAWLEIQKEFNSINPGKLSRDLAQLKGLWKRLKIKTKAELDALKRDGRRTGGGSPTPPLAKPEKIVADMFSGYFDSTSDTIEDDASTFQEGPEEECAKNGEEEMTYETFSQPSKRKNSPQSHLQERLLEMAEAEHKEKMDILKYKKEYQKLKLLLLEKECKSQNLI